MNNSLINPIMPPFLKEGDLVTFVSPSSCLADSSLIDGAVRCLNSWGLQVSVSPHVLTKCGHFAASDEDRLADLQSAIDNPCVKAIFCSRGGYGALRLLDRLDLSSLRTSPKWIVGFSDVTALHSAFVNAGCCSLHAPMAKALAHSHTQKSILHRYHDIMFGLKKMDYKEPANPYNRCGVAEGMLVGGNLSLIYAMQGTPFQIPSDGAILFIEDLSEKVYHIDRMMHNLRLSGVLGRISGLVVGQFTDINPDPDFGQTIEEIILNVVRDYDIPVAFDFPVGHVGRNFPLVEGARVKLKVADGGVSLRQI